ncbi:MAG: DUF6134 family protein [Pseudomonadota bacterium]
MVPTVARAETARRTFRIVRGGSNIGEQTITVEKTGERLRVAIDIEIAVKLLGITAYRYEMSNVETWSNGAVQTISARTRDNGKDAYVEAERTVAGLNVRGSGYTGTVRGDIATTTYWTTAFLKRPVWISTQDGAPFDITARQAGPFQFPTTSGSVSATQWQTSGDLELALFYDAQGEWVGSEFDAQGTAARFISTGTSDRLSALWSNA